MEDIKEKIINSAQMLFAQNGCKHITMDDISNSIRISKRTLYENFSNKEDVILACIENWNKRIETEAFKIERTTQFPIWRMIYMGKLFQVYTRINQRFLSDIEKYYTDIYNSKLCYPLNLRTKHLERCLQLAKEQGYFNNNVDLGVAAMIMANCTHYVLQSKVIPLDKRSTIVREFMTNYMRGLLTIEAIRDFDNSQEQMMRQLDKITLESFQPFIQNESVN